MNPLKSARDWVRTRFLNAQLRALNGGGGYVPSAPVLSGTFVTPETALGLTAVFCAINVISRDVASCPRNVYKKLPGGGRVIDFAHRVQPLINRRPNDHMTAFRYFQAEMAHVLGRGNGYSEIERRKGYPSGLHPLHPSKTIPKFTASGGLVYELNDKAGSIDPSDKPKVLAAEDVLHFAGLGFNGIVGYSPITLSRQTIGLAFGAEQFGAAFFGNGAVPKGILKHPKRLGEGAWNNLRRTFNQIYQGSQSAHQVMILEEGLDWQNTQVTPEDGQFIATRQFQVIDIARIFSIPPHKIGDYSQAHLSSVEEANLDYICTTILGWVRMLEDELNEKLLTEDDRKTHEIGIDMSAFMRGNAASRIAFYQGMRNMGAINSDEIRVREGMNPIGPELGGDKYLVQGQYIPLDQAGKQPVIKPAPTPPEKHTPNDPSQ